MNTGASVTIVGVGPGDPELLTLKAVRALEQSQVILHPGPRDDAGFAVEVIAQFIKPHQVVRGMGLAMRRGADDGSVGYDRVAQSLAAIVHEGRRASFLTEGDPMLFGSGSYVAEHLARFAPEITVEVIPGISAITAAAARLGWPLAQKEEILTVCPATYHADDIPRILAQGGPVCWLKVVGVLPRLVEELRRTNRLERAALIEKVGRPEERIFHDVSQALGQDLSYFSLVLVR